MSQLTRTEKARLLADFDSRHMGDIDEEFYELLTKTRPLGPEKVDDKIRRTLLKYIEEHVIRPYTDFFKPEEPLEEQLFVLISLVFTQGFMTGFEVARKTKRGIKHSGKNI